MLDQGVENGQQLAHAGGKGDLLGLSSLEEVLIEGLDNRVEPSRTGLPRRTFYS
jgi:hypothetical protein